MPRLWRHSILTLNLLAIFLANPLQNYMASYNVRLPVEISECLCAFNTGYYET